MKVKVKVILGSWYNVTTQEFEMTEEEFKQFEQRVKKGSLFARYFHGETFSIWMPQVFGYSKG